MITLLLPFLYASPPTSLRCSDGMRYKLYIPPDPFLPGVRSQLNDEIVPYFTEEEVADLPQCCLVAVVLLMVSEIWGEYLSPR